MDASCAILQKFIVSALLMLCPLVTANTCISQNVTTIYDCTDKCGGEGAIWFQNIGGSPACSCSGAQFACSGDEPFDGTCCSDNGITTDSQCDAKCGGSFVWIGSFGGFPSCTCNTGFSCRGPCATGFTTGTSSTGTSGASSVFGEGFSWFLVPSLAVLGFTI